MGRSVLGLIAALPLLVACERPSVLVLALDGASWQVMDPLMEAGFLPTLRDLVSNGVRGEYDCAPALPAVACFCPPVWASLATGRVAAEHGIVAADQPPSDRQSKALWSVLHDYGGSSTAVSMRTTWPPDPDVDYVLTPPGLTFAASEIYRSWPGAPSGAALIPELRTAPEGLFESLGLLPHAGERPTVWNSIARDRVSMEALRRLLAVERTDLAFVLLHSPDKVEHLLWSTVQRSAGEPFDVSALLAFAEAWEGPVEAPAPFGWGTVAAPYLEIDAWLGELLAEFPFDYVVLVSDHGMTRNPGAGLAGVHGPETPSAHRGILVFRGRDVRRGVEIGTVDVLDFAPTVAHLLDLPIGADLPGRVLEEVFEPRRFRRRPIRRVASWEQSPLAGLLEFVAAHADQASDRARAVRDRNAQRR